MTQLAHIIKQHSNLPEFEIALRDEYNNPVDLSSATDVTLKMKLIGDPSVTGGGLVDILEEESGLVSYEFEAGDTLISGSYLATIQATFPGGKIYSFPYNDFWLISVEPDLDSDSDDTEYELVFATVAQARQVGKELSVQELLIAQSHIEVMCGRMIESIQDAMENDAISKADLKRLRMATIFQAEWIKANPDVEERTDVKTIRTAGLSGEAAELTADGITLAPLARRLLIGLSWVRSRSVRTTTQKGSGPISLRTTTGPGWKDM